jgi:hypothetical protein
MRGGRFKTFCFTEYDLSKERKKFWETFPCRYVCCGEKICPNTNKKYLHGYIYFNNARSKSRMIKICIPTQIKPCGGYFRDKLDYCSKELENFVEFGEKPKQGKRNDLKATRQKSRCK